MNIDASSCDFQPGQTPPGQGSRVVRFEHNYRWEGIPVEQYKSPADHWCGVTRHSLIGPGDKTAFHVRYFEIAPGGFSTLEHHVHAHVVLVLRGNGEVQLGEDSHQVAHGDLVYVAPHAVHQLRNLSTTEPFGFLCIVDAVRDQPVRVDAAVGERSLSGPA